MQEIFAERFTGHPSREDQDEIKKLKKAVLRLAEIMDANHQNQER